MDEDSPDGCYGTRCEDCKLNYVKPGSKEHDECRRLCRLAIERYKRDDE